MQLSSGDITGLVVAVVLLAGLLLSGFITHLISVHFYYNLLEKYHKLECAQKDVQIEDLKHISDVMSKQCDVLIDELQNKERRDNEGISSV